MNKKVIVVGAGGHGKVIADIVCLCGDTVLGFLDDGKSGQDTVSGVKVLGKISDYCNYRDAEFIIAIGNPASRANIVNMMGDSVNYYTAVHPRAVISGMGVSIGEGSAVMANAVLSPSSSVGRHSIINTSAVVEHDCNIGNYVHVSVGAKLGGTVLIGDHTWVGIGATVSNNVSICDHCMIGAGAVVVHDIKEIGTYVGVPARKIK